MLDTPPLQHSTPMTNRALLQHLSNPFRRSGTESPGSAVQLEVRPGPEAELSILDPFHAGRWVERLWILRDRIREGADGWQNPRHLPWESADPKSGPVRFEAVGLDSRRNLSCSNKEFVGEILKQFTRSQASAFGCTFAASTWMYLDEPSKAREWLRRALDMDPGYVPAYVVRAMVSYYMETGPGDSMADVDKALSLKSDYVPALMVNALHGPREDSTEPFENFLDKALNINPRYVDGLVLSSGTMMQSGLDPFAVDLLNEALEIDPAHAEAYCLRAKIRSAWFQWQEALDDLTTALNLAPSHMDTRLNKATCHWMLSQYDEAEAEASRGVNQHPGQAPLLLLRANIRADLARYDDAAADFDAAIRIDPDNPMAYAQRGTLRHQVERFDLSLEDYDRALALEPNFAPAHAGRGLALLELERFPEAQDSAKAILAIDNEDHNGWYIRGRVHIAMGRYKRAIPDLNRVLQQAPNHVEARCYRGLAKEKAGNRKGARKDYARAYRTAMEFGSREAADLVIKLFPDLHQHKEGQ